VLAPDRRSGSYYCQFGHLTLSNSTQSPDRKKIVKHQLQNKAVEVVENSTGYKCEISPAINKLNVVQMQKIYIAVGLHAISISL